MSRPVVIGLTGGVASGKSTVAKMFERLGAVVLDGDRLGHEILKNPDVKSDIRAIWGDGVFEDGDVNRSALGNIVFGSPDRKHLSKLESITHPKIRVRILEELRSLNSQSHLAVVLDAPLLFEAGWDELCDKVIFVKTSLSDRIERAQSRGWNETELQRRELQQLDLRHKEQNSTNTIENTTNLKTTFSQVKRLWMSWGLPISDESQP